MNKNQKIAIGIGIGLAVLGLASFVAWNLVKNQKPQEPKIDETTQVGGGTQNPNA